LISRKGKKQNKHNKIEMLQTCYQYELSMIVKKFTWYKRMSEAIRTG